MVREKDWGVQKLRTRKSGRNRGEVESSSPKVRQN